MLSISSKCRYGLDAVLSLAGNYGLGLLQGKEIAAAKKIPRQYLEQIFNRLGKAGIIRSVRGKKGGYELARPPADIKVLDIVNILDGGIDFSTEAKGQSKAINEIFLEAEVSLKDIFSLSLADLATRQQSLQENVTYHI